MIYMLWQYKVAPDKQAEFEQYYGSNGSWAKLFGLTTGFVGTTLIHHTTEPLTYITLDQWSDELSFRRFMHEHKAAYDTLDSQCANITMEEHYLGTYSESLV